MSQGWIVYIIVWFWLGIAVGLANDSAFASFIVWAIGGSAGWLLASTVHQFGWKHAGGRVAQFIVAPLLGCASLLLILGAINAPANRVAGFGVGAVLAGRAAWMLWKQQSIVIADLWPTGGASSTPAERWTTARTPHEFRNDTRYRCPSCRKPSAFRQPGGQLKCDDCGRVG